MDFTHTTLPADSGTYHYWEARGPHGAVSLSLLHSQHPGFASLSRMSPRLAENLAPTDGGHWVFDVVQAHRVEREAVWSCPRHGDRCYMDAIVGDLANPIWDRLRASGVTDATVRAELEPLLDRVFGEVPA